MNKEEQYNALNIEKEAIETQIEANKRMLFVNETFLKFVKVAMATLPKPTKPKGSTG